MISVIVPVYNIEKYLEKCIASVVQQTYPDFELLLINDGSTDASGSICKQWEQRDPRIKAISKANGGVSSARNLGLELAAGDFIFFLDGDDWIRPDCFEKMICKMTPEIDIVSSDYKECDEETYVSDLVLKHKRYEGILSGTEAILDCYRGQIYPRVIWGKLYRKDVWKTVRFNHMAYSEDTYAMFLILERTRFLYSTSEPLYYYLQRSSSASRQKNVREYENHLETLRYLYEKALKDYPAAKEYPAEEYIGVAYALLKKYEQAHQKEKALELIETMQLVYKTSRMKSPAFSRRVLRLPKQLIYRLIALKNLIKKEK